MSSYTCQVLCGWQRFHLSKQLCEEHIIFLHSSDQILRPRGAKWVVATLNHLVLHESTCTMMNYPPTMSLMLQLRSFARFFPYLCDWNCDYVFYVSSGCLDDARQQWHCRRGSPLPAHQTDLLLKNSRQISIWVVSTNLQSRRFHITLPPTPHFIDSL